ncbi:hypothetical protein QR680_012775 [Steinernema hermaphroditum]|uniref:Uncharacterized protein n=1 Tax=Steinernema hermaphroditum TaxID=289476 RepID=A0AA39I5Q2_9BILA|nr:hypothetical protein QR680_012775 [Steinernema hermaphroditum]
MSLRTILVTLPILAVFLIREATGRGCLHARWNFEKLNLTNSTEPVGAVKNFQNLNPEAVAILANYTRNPEPAKFYFELFCVYAVLLSTDGTPTKELLYNFVFGHPRLIPDVASIDAIAADMCEDDAIDFNAGYMDVPYLNTINGKEERRRALFFCCTPGKCGEEWITVAMIIRKAASKRMHHWNGVRKLTNSEFDQKVSRSRCYDILGFRRPKVELNEAVRGCYTPLIFAGGRLNVGLSTSKEEISRARERCEAMGATKNYTENFCIATAAPEGFSEASHLSVDCCCFQDLEECSLRSALFYRRTQRNRQKQFCGYRFTGGFLSMVLYLSLQNIGCKFAVSYDVIGDKLTIGHASVKNRTNDFCEDKLQEEVQCRLDPGDSVLCPLGPSVGKNAVITCCCKGSYCNFHQMTRWLSEFQQMKTGKCFEAVVAEFPLLSVKWTTDLCHRFFLTTTQKETIVLPGVNAEIPEILERSQGSCQRALVRFYPRAIETCQLTGFERMRGNVPHVICTTDEKNDEQDVLTEMKYMARGAIFRCKRGVSSSKEVGITAHFQNELSTKYGFCYTRIYSYGSKAIGDLELETYFVEKGLADSEFYERYPQCWKVSDGHCFLSEDQSVVCCCLSNGNNACNEGFPRLAIKNLIESRLRIVNDELYECPSKQGEEQCASPGCFAIRNDRMTILASG